MSEPRRAAVSPQSMGPAHTSARPRRLKRRVWPWVLVVGVLIFWACWYAVWLYAYFVGW